MVAGSIPIKTPDGLAELRTRQRRLGQRHRTVLFLVDGRRSAVDVRAMALKAGVPEGCFDELIAMGLITLPPRFSVQPAGSSEADDVLHVDLPLTGAGPDPESDSVLPPSRSLYPSGSGDSTLGGPLLPDSWLPSEAGALIAADPSLAEARLILLRAVRAEAPLTGSLTALRLRRARSRAELVALLDEVEARITKPHRTLAAIQTMRWVRQLLGSPPGGVAPAAGRPARRTTDDNRRR